MKKDDNSTNIGSRKVDVKQETTETLFNLASSSQMLAENLSTASGYQVVEIAHQNYDDNNVNLTRNALSDIRYIPIAMNDTATNNNNNNNNINRRLIYFMTPNTTSHVNGNTLTSLSSTATSAKPSAAPKSRLLRLIEPATVQLVGEGSEVKTPKDDRRRATHNEVERRRRDKITTWIGQLGQMLPPSFNENNGKPNESKGDTLSKVCDYIRELQNRNHELRNVVEDLLCAKQSLDETSQKYAEALTENNNIKLKFAEIGVHCEIQIVENPVETEEVFQQRDEEEEGVQQQQQDDHSSNYIDVLVQTATSMEKST